MEMFTSIILSFIFSLLFVSVSTAEDNRKDLFSWFKKENLAIRGSFFGGGMRHSSGQYIDVDAGDTVPVITVTDHFRFEGRASLGGELGIGYKMGHGIELGVSYMLQKVDDYKGSAILSDTFSNPATIPDWHNDVFMDIQSRAVMFNVRTYLDDLTGIEMGRFSPYFLASAGRATHKVTDYHHQDDPSLNGTNDTQTFHFRNNDKREIEFAYRFGLGTLFKLTDHVSVDAHGSFMDWGNARAPRHYIADGVSPPGFFPKPIEPEVRSVQGTIGIQFNF